jgi:hypothetical protein
MRRPKSVSHWSADGPSACLQLALHLRQELARVAQRRRRAQLRQLVRHLVANAPRRILHQGGDGAVGAELARGLVVQRPRPLYQRRGRFPLLAHVQQRVDQRVRPGHVSLQPVPGREPPEGGVSLGQVQPLHAGVRRVGAGTGAAQALQKAEGILLRPPRQHAPARQLQPVATERGVEPRLSLRLARGLDPLEDVVETRLARIAERRSHLDHQVHGRLLQDLVEAYVHGPVRGLISDQVAAHERRLVPVHPTPVGILHRVQPRSDGHGVVQFRERAIGIGAEVGAVLVARHGPRPDEHRRHQEEGAHPRRHRGRGVGHHLAGHIGQVQEHPRPGAAAGGGDDVHVHHPPVLRREVLEVLVVEDLTEVPAEALHDIGVADKQRQPPHGPPLARPGLDGTQGKPVVPAPPLADRRVLVDAPLVDEVGHVEARRVDELVIRKLGKVVPGRSLRRCVDPKEPHVRRPGIEDAEAALEAAEDIDSGTADADDECGLNGSLIHDPKVSGGHSGTRRGRTRTTSPSTPSWTPRAAVDRRARARRGRRIGPSPPSSHAD